MNTILNDNDLTMHWFNDIQTIRRQMNRMRSILSDGLQIHYQSKIGSSLKTRLV